MKYAELLPMFLEIPKELPAQFRADLSCVFHQGAPGHDIEGCYAFKNEVQDLVEANLMPF